MTTDSIERFIEDQAFSPVAPPPPSPTPYPISRLNRRLTGRKTEKARQLSDGRWEGGGGGGAKSYDGAGPLQIIQYSLHPDMQLTEVSLPL